MTYARRVRKFTYEDSDYLPQISTASLEEISLTRTSLSLLPHLHEPTYSTASFGHWRFAVLFMNESVRRFIFQLDNQTEPLQLFLDSISTRMPYLTTLDLQTNLRASDIEEDFIRLLSELPHLEEVVVPAFHITSRVMETLAKLPNLGVIDSEYVIDQAAIGDKRDVRNFNPRAPKDGFPVLRNMALSAHLSQFIPLVAGTLAPAAKNLTSLVSVENGASVRQCFTVVGESFPLIKSIHLEALPGPIMSTQ